MSRTILLAATAALALAGSAAPARAQWTVICPNCAQEVSQIASWGKQAADMLSQLTTLKSQLESTARAVGDGNIIGAISGVAGLSSSYHPAANQMSGILGGTSGTWGQGAAQINQNNYYLPQTSDLAAQEMQRRATVTANAQAIALEGMASTEEQIAKLNALQGQLGATNTVVDAGVTNGAIAAAQQNIALNRARLDQAQLMLTSARRVDEERDMQMARESADTMAKNTEWALESSWGGTITPRGGGFSTSGATSTLGSLGSLASSASGLVGGSSALGSAAGIAGQANSALSSASTLGRNLGQITGGW